MLLTYNIGNSETKIGIVNDGKLISDFAVSTAVERTSDEYFCIFKSLMEAKGFSPTDFTGAICSSVAPSVTEPIKKAMEAVSGIKSHILCAGTKTGLNIFTDDPSQLGGDLVALSVGALQKYKPPMIIIEFGTATTFSVLDEDGRFVGCAIAPGCELSLKALSNGAGLLPSIMQTPPKKCVGTNTIESMQSGTVFGNAAMVDGMIMRIEEELATKFSVIASGSAGERIIPCCKRKILRDDTLLFVGLAKIYEKNARNLRTKTSCENKNSSKA